MPTRILLSLVGLLLNGCALINPPLPPLAVAARSGDLASIRCLSQDTLQLNQFSGVNGWTPLLHAVHKQQRASITALLEAGADPNVRSAGGLTPLMMAAGYGYEDIVRELLHRGADARMRYSNGSTALDFAVSGVVDIDRFTLQNCQTATVRLLLEATPGLRLHTRPWDQIARRLKTGRGCTELRSLLARRHAEATVWQ